MVCEENLYLDQVLRNHAQMKIKDATQKLGDWANAATSAKKKTANSVLEKNIHIVADCQGVYENLHEEILRRRAARGMIITYT